MTRAELELAAKAAMGIGLVVLHYLLWSRSVRSEWSAARIESAS